ncbi:MAG TPA: hypothetical protein VK817_15725 [Trebonia sp.]|jgi:ABC-2 type transport system permease protein|nr:hypothetical protein [Trebonia sp.]
MTVASIRPARTRVPALATRARDVLAFEWVKLRSVRANWVTALAAAAATLGVTVIVARTAAAVPAHQATGSLAPLLASFLASGEYTILPVSVLGVLAFTSEYASGLIRTTFAAVPHRWAVLAAKAAVLGGAALALGEVLAFACFLVAQALLSGSHLGLSLGQPGVPGAVLAAGFLPCACVLTALGLGAIIRSTAGAITAAVAVIYAVAGLCLVLPAPWKTDIGRFTIGFAAYQVMSGHPQRGLLPPAASMLVLIAWPAVALLVAGAVLARRDA